MERFAPSFRACAAELLRRPTTHTSAETGAWCTTGKLLFWAMVCVLLTSQAGCVQRRLTVRTNPPGALLYVDDYEIGTTPISTDFIYYGKRKIRLVKDGYETLIVTQWIPPPWYEVPPLDFISENLVPGYIRDQRVLDFQLKPQTLVPTEQLISRAEGLRRGLHAVSGVGSPQPGAPTGTPLPSTPTPQQSPETIPAPEGLGGRSVYPLPPGSGR